MSLITLAMGFAACSSDDDHDSTRPTPWPEVPGSSGITRTYALNDTLRTNNLKLTWSDEFNEGTMPNESYWTYEQGYVRNSEVQAYTVARPENCKIENGILIITGRKEETPYKDSKGEHTYTSASLITNKKLSWKYGRFEVRAKVPAGKTGIWPAFWAKGDSQNTGKGWPQCGEIDIMEYAAKDPNNMIQNVIWGANSTDKTNVVFRAPSPTAYSNDYHVYSLNWSETQLTFAIDNKVTQVVNMKEIDDTKYDNPFHQNFSLLLNLALGTPTDSSLGGMFDESTLPVQFLVDYVRVYQTDKTE